MSILSGTIYYNETFGSNTRLGVANIIVFFALLLCIEIYHQIHMRRETPFKGSDNLISSEQFEQRIAKGEKLVILDDLVLDISHYAENHPGGRFLLHHNIGRDVSKFFYGGYSMENFNGNPKAHTHTNIARVIVN